MGISIKRIFWSLLFSFGLFGSMHSLEQQPGIYSSQPSSLVINPIEADANAPIVMHVLPHSDLELSGFRTLYIRKAYLPF
ncbi:hypothetical protein AB9P05_09085 [Roseivirga sp. BDSF3-8]|uniref:hypothetical protein n=1 Tax=Roseivirga sp. BDSF3-8 TaxID=3241598 RepID=UPI003531F010